MFVALVFLILLTILGLAAAGSSVLQERMTGGTRNRQLAMMGVESAVRGGEFAVWSAPELANYSAGGDVMAPCTTGASNCVFVADGRTGQLDSVVQTFRSKREWVATFDYGTRIYAPPLNGLTGNKETASLASQPLFIIEDLGNDLSGLGPLAGKYKMGGAILPETGGGKGPPPRRLYRVTARSQGGSAQAAARVAESVYSAYGTNHQYNPDATP
ncbi:MAG TPA: PilX N-terminal domain-containing pilus assembly protein [Tahibacter sp.]|nr:PilX N-terminal domain-containing pilus assembly protein [Tahibacter sp.]